MTSTSKTRVQVVPPVQADQLSPARAASRQQAYKPYQRSGNICLDALQATCHLMGASGISLSGGVLSCTYSNVRYSIPVTSRTRCTEVIDILRRPPQPPAGERRTDPAAWSVQLAA